MHWLLGAGCGSSGTTPAGSADAGATATSTRWGTETAEGPRVHGTMMGTRSSVGINGAMETGTLYDSTGSGHPDEIDLDGDGVSDGEDINGDGVITIWRDLPEADDVSTPAMLDLEVPTTPAAVENHFAATAPLPGESATGPILGASGGVNLMGGMVPTGVPMPGVLRPRNQGETNACGAFSVAGSLALVRYAADRVATPTVDINTLWPSPLYIYQYGAMIGSDGLCGGTAISTNFNRVMMFGAPSEAELPFPASPPASAMTVSLCTAPATDAAATSPNRESFRIGGHVRIGGTGLAWRTEVKRQLSMGRPVVFGCTLPLGFSEFRTTTAAAAGRTTDVTQPFRGNGQCTTSGHCGGHGMVITGYDDARSAYRVLNSWGGDWGDNGYLWWDYASLEAQPALHASAPIALPAGTPPLGPPNSAGITLALAPMTTPAYARLAPDANGLVRWGLIARVQFSEPVTVTTILTDVAGSQFTDTISQAMLSGDLSGAIAGSGAAGYDPMSRVGQTVTITVTGTTRDGTTITRALPSFMVPAPTPAT